MYSRSYYYLLFWCVSMNAASGYFSDGISYILCIDGGGSKTALQIIDTSCRPLAFEKNGVLMTECKVGSSNINTVGVPGLQLLFSQLFDDIAINGRSLASVANECSVIGGFAGLTTQSLVTDMTRVLTTFGFKYMHVCRDIDIITQFIKQGGIALIAGTGSICFAKHADATLRVGGLGRHLGDEGGGYYIGKSAIKASLESFYGYGQKTVLEPALSSHFKLQNIQQIVAPFYAGTITAPEVAALAPLVFEKESSDVVAAAIIENAIDQLAHMLQLAVHKLDMKPSTIYLTGGIFKNSQADQFIKRMVTKAGLQEWNIENIAFEHPVVALMQATRSS